MTGHPGGQDHTEHMLALAKLTPPARFLDLGAGHGETVQHLRDLGYDAEGVDIEPGVGVKPGDMLCAPYPQESFDAIISQCAFYVSGDAAGAFRESYRLLRPMGHLLLSDVSFDEGLSLQTGATQAGLRVLSALDMTAEWRRYYLACVWNGTVCAKAAWPSQGVCSYWLLVCQKS